MLKIEGIDVEDRRYTYMQKTGGTYIICRR